MPYDSLILTNPLAKTGARMNFSYGRTPLAASLFVFAVAPAQAAVYRCQQPDGHFVYQDTPCATGTQKTIDTSVSRAPSPAVSSPVPDYKPQLAELERRGLVRDAIASGMPMVSMTRAELDQAMGNPDKINTSQYGSSLQDQLIYYRHGRTLYVYTRDGVVTSIQDTQGTISSQRRKPCPSDSVWNIEIEINKTMNRDNRELQTELHKQLLEAKACQ